MCRREARIPPALFDHVAHRRALLVLDNLEQMPGRRRRGRRAAGRTAPQVVVVATSRRPLHVPGEHEHPVPPLELPDRRRWRQRRLGAVQLFVQHARMVQPDFALTADNAADVVAICRRLDGLPLAIELAAARIKLLSPQALLARLDTALDLVGDYRPAATRQQTLRDTIAWSYQLLTPAQQQFFRRLAVFAGGADLSGVAAVCDQASDEPLDLVADLVDASLLAVADDADGEPRVHLLETVRTFALDELAAHRRAGSSPTHPRAALPRHRRDDARLGLPKPGDGRPHPARDRARQHARSAVLGAGRERKG